jgi:type IV secretion system protein TrbF
MTPHDGALNPYLAARREWSARYGEYIRQAHHWRAIAATSAVVLLVAVVGAVHIRAQRRIQPYLVQVGKLDEEAVTAQARSTDPVDPRIIKAYLARFVADWRGVTTDRQAQKAAIDRAYVMLPNGSAALVKVNAFFKGRNPFAVSARGSVGVAVTSLLPISSQTWEVEWQETTRDVRGQLLGTVRMKVTIIVGITPPADESLMVINPLGVYITDLNWSRVV